MFGEEAERDIRNDKETITIKNYQYAEMISTRFDFIILKLAELWKNIIK